MADRTLAATLAASGIVATRHLAHRPFAECLAGTLASSREPVFIKVLRSDVHKVRRNFLREIDVLAALAGRPGIPRIVASSKHDPVFHACRFVRAPLLTRFIADGVNADLDQIGRHLASLARWIRAFHASGYVHRDLSPEHVMLTGPGRVTVVDYGLAKATAGCPDPALARGRDLQAMGLIAWELICAKPVFHFNSVRLRAQIPRERSLLQQLLPDGPLTRLLAQCMAFPSELTPAFAEGRAPGAPDLDELLDLAVSIDTDARQ